MTSTITNQQMRKPDTGGKDAAPPCIPWPIPPPNPALKVKFSKVRENINIFIIIYGSLL